MTCAELGDRLLDEDCRAALLGRAKVPADVAEHAAQCPACSRQWVEAARDSNRLSAGLLAEPSPALRRALHRSFRRREAVRLPRIEQDTIAWVVVVGVLGATLAGNGPVGPRLSQWTGLWVGAALGLALGAARQTGSVWPRSLSLALKAGSRSLGRMVRLF